jgi:hypothetical protein
MQAVEGEEVWVVVNHVKADKRAEFEKFYWDVFLPLGKKVTGNDRKAFIATRLLVPTKAEVDGTYSYIYLMAPVIKGVDYQIDNLLKRFYGEAKAREFEKQAEGVFAKPQIGYIQKQSKLF